MGVIDFSVTVPKIRRKLPKPFTLHKETRRARVERKTHKPNEFWGGAFNKRNRVKTMWMSILNEAGQK